MKLAQPMTTTRISELISKRSKAQIYKISATVRDSLQYQLKREGYVERVDVNDKSLYSNTSEGKKILEGWIAFSLCLFLVVFVIHKVAWR